MHIDRKPFSWYNHRVKKKVKVVLYSHQKVKPFVYQTDAPQKSTAGSLEPKIFEFKDDEIDMYCDDENLPPIYKQIEELYLFLKDVEVERREQVLREVCPDEPEENIKAVMDCITTYEREHGLRVLTKKEQKALKKKQKAEEKAFMKETIIY